jgi:RNA binding exosome subunit
MRCFHTIIVSVFVKEEEDYQQIKLGFLELFPFKPEDEKVIVSEKIVSTFNDRKIRILEVRLTKTRHINEFMQYIRAKMSDSDKKMIIEQIDSRVDGCMNFFFRLSKKKLLEEGKFVVVDHGDCYHFKCHVASYPQNREKAKVIVKNFFEECHDSKNHISV